MVLQRYTPPTCTLVIMANGSPLSRWAGRPVVKDLRFELSFDAPQLPEEQKLTIWGNRTQLEALYEAVTTYVQNLLHQSSASMDAPLLTRWQKSDAESDFRNAEDAPETVRNQRFDAEEARSAGEFNFNADPSRFTVYPSSAAPAARSRAELNRPGNLESWKPALVPVPAVDNPDNIESLATGIHLQPRGLLSHDLFLGSLATEDSGPVVHLGVLQLFDLATALDEYTAEMVALPSLQQTRAQGLLSLVKNPPAWVNTAAIVLLTVGLTTAVGKFLQPTGTNLQTASSKVEAPGNAPQQQPRTAEQQKIAIVPPPPPPLATVPPAAVQQQPAQKLPSLPPGAVMTPNSLPAVPVPQTVPNIPSELEIPPQPVATNPAIPTKPSVAIPEIPTAPSQSTPPQSLSPNLGTSTAPNIELNPRTTPPAAQDKANQQLNPAPSGQPVTPSVAPAPATPNAPRAAEPPPELPSVTLPDQLPADGAPASQDSLRSSASEPAETAAAPPQAEAQTSGMLNSIPQVDEARNYFQQRWKPPSSLTQPLEYTLSLNADGSIQKIIPRGLTAGTFVDRTGMPLLNEPFVSPVQGEQTTRIRVVLRPDGQVQTFLEPFKEGF